MKKIRNFVIFISCLLVGFSIINTTNVGAVNAFDGCSGSNADSIICKDKDEDVSSILKTVINAMLFLIGAVSIIMIILSGVWYVISRGDQNLIKRAKDTLMYSVIGLIIAILAAAIVNFVLSIFKIG